MNTIENGRNTAASAAGGYAAEKKKETAGVSHMKKISSKNKVKKKSLNYNHREISQRILRASKPASAATVLASARSKLGSLRRCQGTGQYNEQELTNAIIHARRMVQCASKKVQNLKGEEIEKKRLERRSSTEDTVRKVEARQRIERKEQQLKQELLQKETMQMQKEKREWMELKQKEKWNRNNERSKVNDANMKYIKGKLSIMQQQGQASNSSEILRLQASLEELGREQMRLQAEQGADAPSGETAGAEGAAVSSGVSESSMDFGAGAVGGMVDICL